MGFSVSKIVKSVVGGAPGLLDAVTGGANSAGATGIASSLFGGDSNVGSLLSSVVSGAVGLGTDYLQSQQNLSAQKDLAAYTAARQNELNEATYQRNLQQWNVENQYNSPAAQMQRYAEAGLNPNLIYGQSNLSAGSTELKPATYNPGEYQPVDHSAQRQALKLALLEHAQRIENQAIENDLARQRLLLAEQANIRANKLADSLISQRSKKEVDKPMSTPGKMLHDVGYYWDSMKEALGIGNGISAELF